MMTVVEVINLELATAASQQPRAVSQGPPARPTKHKDLIVQPEEPEDA